MASNYSHKEHFRGLFGTPAISLQSMESSAKEGQLDKAVIMLKKAPKTKQQCVADEVEMNDRLSMRET